MALRSHFKYKLWSKTLILQRYLLQPELLWHAKIHEGNGISCILQRDNYLSEYTHTTTSKVDTSFTLPLHNYFLMQHKDNVWGNVLINQNSSSPHRHIFRYWMLSTGHLHPTETNSCICLIIWEWKWDCDIEIMTVMVLCTLLMQFYSLGP